jgi:hypothetical protein
VADFDRLVRISYVGSSTEWIGEASLKIRDTSKVYNIGGKFQTLSGDGHQLVSGSRQEAVEQGTLHEDLIYICLLANKVRCPRLRTG